ncbi:MAG TPA: FAD-binding oxidoreductase [Longimicrobiaceae bacterium]|nr:FAD-binding oxidoreductase [Longimicrobiaceae bacterium]
MALARLQPLSGWGRFPVQACRLYRPEKRSELAEVLRSHPAGGCVSRGLGRAYGDAALNQDGGVVSHLRLNRLLDFDPATGVLECEAGVSFAEILATFLPRGWFLPVTPGTKFVTVGGAVAADVHGKNHHRDGTIARFVERLTLLTPARGVLHCSPDENTEVFWATVGGMGLTGAILAVRLRLAPVESAYVTVDEERTPHVDAALERFAESDDGYRYSVAWIDCLATGRALGRGVLMRGNHAPAAQARGRDPLALPHRRGTRVPVELPAGTLNRFSVAAFNRLYRAAHPDRAGRLVDLDAFFYPLDAVRDWNRLYGRRGFVQYQAVLPLERGRDGMVRLLEALAASRRPSFLAVLKRFGDANPGLLSFPLAGYTLALDLPVAAGLVEFVHGLDRVVLEHGGRVYLAKDATLTPASFAAMYPQAERFRAVKAELDPEGVLTSSLARRVGLAP